MIECTCVLSALLFVVSNLLGFSYFHRFRQQHHGGGAHSSTNFFQNFTALDPDFIQGQWEYHNDHYFTELTAGILNAMAWMIFCIPLVQVAWIQSRQGTRLLGLHVAMAALAMGGSITELIARLMFIGATSTGSWLSRDFNLDTWIEASADGGGQPDMIGWRTLEMISLITRGLLLWIDAAEWLFLSAIFTLIFLSVLKTEVTILSKGWARLGLVIALLAFCDFSSEVLRLKSWRTFSFVAIFISWISRLLLMPIWLLWLGRQLTRVRLDQAGTSGISASGGAHEMTHYGKNADREEDAAVYS